MNTKNYKIYKQLLQRGLTPERIRKMDFSDFNFIKFDFVYSNFVGANFARANFASANFDGASFDGANFDRASFDRASFARANFAYASFAYASFAYANFVDANFAHVNFVDANFAHVNFARASFVDAILVNITVNESTFGLTINCPETGSFIAYKKAKGRIVTIRVEEDAKRSSATTYKCRCNKATVLEIEGGITEIASNYDSSFIYRVGETIEVKDFDDNRWNECSTGIHFFINRKMAECYN